MTRDPGAAPRAGWPTRDILRAASLLAAVWIALYVVWVARMVFVIAFIGLLAGIALSGGVTWLRRFGVPRGLGAVIWLAIVAGALGGLALLIASTVAEQLQQLWRELPGAVAAVQGWLREQMGQAIPSDAALKSGIGDVGARVLEIVRGAASGAAGVVVVLFIAVFIAIDPAPYQRGILHLVPHPARPKALEILRAIGVSLRRWLTAQAVGMLVIGTLTTIVMLLLDIRAAVTLGLLAGILEFIPYLGPVLAAVPAVAMGFLDGPEKALWVIAAYVVIQQIEGNVVTPLLMKEGLDVPPALTIVTQLVMAYVFGFLGLLIAMPLLGTIMVPIKLLYVHDVVGDDVPVVPGRER